LFLDQHWASLCVRPNVQARRLLGKDLMVPKQGPEKAEAACLLSNTDYTSPSRIVQLPLVPRSYLVLTKKLPVASDAAPPGITPSKINSYLKSINYDTIRRVHTTGEIVCIRVSI